MRSGRGMLARPSCRGRAELPGSDPIGWTDLVLGPHRPVRVVDGLIAGWHDAGTSHLLLLEAVAGPDLVTAAYREAIEHRYLWHEFKVSALLLPGRRNH